ncbi:sap domain-containing protein [Colletotrichum musicola]|uniref:Sap domain-containing protein n=1 Tax=Colletotrichum musicola TaxID=2175873 RepID=A0A8H6KTW3_9PEZI|nr:sap domain-containing protein [Colletotrichum musicola]
MKDWSKQTVVQLKAELKRRGLAQAGLKHELVTRLVEDDAAAIAAENEAQAAESDPAESSEPQHGDSAKPSVDSAPAVSSPNEAAIVEPEPEPETAAKDADQSAPEAVDEPAAPAESDKSDAVAPAPETMPSVEPPTPAHSEVAQDAQKRKRSESPTDSPEAASRKRMKAEANGDSHSSEPSGLTGVISKIKEGLEEGTSIADDIANDAKDISENLPPPPAGEPMEQDQPQPKDDNTEDVEMTTAEDIAMTTAEDVVNGKALQEPHDANVHASDVEHADGKDQDDPYQAKEKQEAIEQTRQPTPLQDDGDAMEFERDVEPAIHPATPALYIKNFMRPLRDNVVQEHLLRLAAPVGANTREDDIEDFYIDAIRTHAFVVFRTTALASRVRNALHDVIWPDERERKPLWVDFVPPEKVKDWIDEESQAGRRRGARWEVLYDREDDGFVVARLDSGTAPPPALSAPEPFRPVPSGPAVKDVNAIPLGPRGGRGFDGAPLGPRGDAPRGPGGRGPRQIPNFPGGPIKTTQKNPPISYQPVSEDLASRRVRNMRSFYTQDLKRDMGPETDINRYTFEQGDSFVDRGQEVFVGIRPPHRERDAQRRRQMGGPPPSRGHPGGRGRRNANRRLPRPLSDRYLPGINESGPYRQGDRGNYGPRFDDDRRDRLDDRDRRY